MEDKEPEPMDDLRDFLEKKVKEAQDKPPAPPPPPAEPFSRRHPRLVLALQLGVIAAAAVYVYSALPAIRGAAQGPQQLRLGAYGADRGTEQCIGNLWKTAAGMETSGNPSCPVCGLPYKTDGGKIACPAPDKHGLTELYFQPRTGVVARGPQ
ncbi:MAG TPA: hypothetical protein DEQ38_02945 [Elusimicrobia bacterium]|nr:hypothetical protein [Elusimicrobiota bacterium]